MFQSGLDAWLHYPVIGTGRKRDLRKLAAITIKP
jgi:hypothetical protein